MKFVVVTGMSGAGKRTAMKMLEDTGFYCVDNLPAALISTFVELITLPKSDINKVALGLDVRSDKSFREINQTLASMKSSGLEYEILFMDASDEVLIKRYKESRRVHPIEGSSTEESIEKERQILQEIRRQADYIIDTSNLLTRELKEELDRIFVKNEAYNSLMIQILSFGFKHGIPLDADLVFDVRFLPNPFYIEDLKYKTGNDKEVSDYVMSFPEAEGFLDKLTDMIQFLIPNYIKEGKYRLVVCIGCTGGRHRSVTLANALFDRMKNMGDYGLTLMHRDMDRSN
ncbi:MAG: RNase adapter RapZ [Lachnospiraceae bacterium]|nr:RNase adapter RapZ [Lachnospiraceae bacterium]